MTPGRRAGPSAEQAQTVGERSRGDDVQGETKSERGQGSDALLRKSGKAGNMDGD